MRAENLKRWIETAREEGNLDPSRWRIVVEIIHLEFETGELVSECTWSNNVLLLKGGGKYREIVLVVVLGKLIDIIIERSLEDYIEFHDVLHGFR